MKDKGIFFNIDSLVPTMILLIVEVLLENRSFLVLLACNLSYIFFKIANPCVEETYQKTYILG